MTHRILRTNRQRIAWTNTSRIVDAEIVTALRWLAEEIDLDGTIFHFKRSGERRRTYGRAYNGIPSIANTHGLDRDEWRYLAVVSDGRGLDSEWFITLAHEAKHIEQFKQGQRGSEPPAKAFATWSAAERAK